MCIIDWCNENDGFLSALLAALAILGPFRIAHTQNKIALFEKRLECYQKLMALKSFSTFANRFDSFELQPELDPIYQCQQEYLYVHGVLTDEKRAQMCRVGNMSRKYAMNCLDKDTELFTSIQMLLGVKEDKTLSKIQSALKGFVETLFISKVPSEIKPAQEKLFEAFANAEKCCNSLRYEVKMHHTLLDYFEKLRGEKHDKS